MTDSQLDLGDVASQVPAPQPAQAARMGYYGALGTNPDTYADAQKMARQVGVPVDVAMDNPEEIKQQAAMGSINFDDLAVTAPATAKLLSDFDKAKVAHDDVPSMVGVEDVLNFWKGNNLAIFSALFKSGEQVAGLGRAGADVLSKYVTGPIADAGVLPVDIAQPLSQAFTSIAKNQREWANYLSPPADSTLVSGIHSGLQSLTQNLMMLPFAYYGAGTQTPLLLMSALTGGESYGKAKDAGLSTERSLLYAAGDSAAEYMGEKAGMDLLFKHVKIGDSWVKSFMSSFVPDQAGEQVTTILQDYNEQVNLHPEKTFADYLSERPNAALQTAIATTIGQGGMVTVGKMMDAVAQTDQQKANKAAQDADMMRRLVEISKAAKVLQRDPETFESFLKDATADGPAETMYIDAKALYQSGVADQLFQAMPDIAAQMPIALESYGKVQIPTAEFLAKAVPAGIADQLIDHIKFDPDGFSRSEAQTELQAHGEALQAEVEQAIAQAKQEDAFKENGNLVTQKIKDLLDATGYNTQAFYKGKPENANEHYAQMLGAFYTVKAAQAGMTPEQLYNQYPISFTSGKAGVGANTLTQQAQPFPVEKQVAFDKFATGQPVTFNFIHNTESATKIFGKPKKGDTYQRDLEPSGRYVNEGTLGEGSSPRMVSGELTFNNPLVLNVNTWKQDLFDHYKKRGKALSQALIDDGYDGVVTVHQDDRPGRTHVSEILDLTTFEPSKALYQLTAFEKSSDAATRTDTDGIVSGGDTARSTIAEDSIDQQIDQYYQSTSKKQANRGAFSPESLNIHLFKSNNLSTVLHESGHFFLHVQFDLASRIAAKPSESLTDGEREIVNDAQAILDWFGVPNINAWYAMDFEQQRAFHEQFAEGYETYLFEGKSPSIELQGVFQRFTSWLLGIYKKLKNMAPISPEMRGVFDRMLATREQIELAQRSRSMIPLFTREDAEAIGLTPEWFAEYQSLYREESADAVDDMQAKAMRDMAYSRNAHGRMFKKLQKEAEEKRRELRIAATADIMSQPVYRAWALLTNRIRPEDKVTAPAPIKSNPDVVDPRIDSLMTAIAKLGGLNKQSALESWGVDPAYKPQSGVFGKPVWRREGGKSIEGMAESLIEHGYLSADKHGKHDLKEFEELFDRALRGEDIYSTSHNYDYDQEVRNGEHIVNPQALISARFDYGELLVDGYPQETIALLKERGMTAKVGLTADLVAGLVQDENGQSEFSSGEALVDALLNAVPPKEAIEAETDTRMLEQYGELATPAAIARSADAAIYNDVRARMLAHELNGLQDAADPKVGNPGQPKRRLLMSAAKEFAQNIIDMTKVRNLAPGMFTNSAVKAGRESKKAHEKGEVQVAIAEKRNQIINELAAKATYNAQDEVKKIVAYLRKFEKDSKTIDPDYKDQIDQLLERYDLKPVTNRGLDKRKSLSTWLKGQEDMGIFPDIPDYLTDSMDKTSYKDMTVAELRALSDAVKTIEHLGRLKNRLLLAARTRDLNAARDEIVAAIEEFSRGEVHANRDPATAMEKMADRFTEFKTAHYKVATLARIMDGDKDGGVVWDYFVRTANERSNYESTKIHEITKKLSEILDPVISEKGFNKKVRTPTLGRDLTRSQIFTLALNTGNDGNLQRLLDGEHWTMDKLVPVFQANLTASDWQAIQQIWNTFEELRPEIAEKERRVYGKEPEWVANRPFTVQAKGASGKLETVSLQGGYYPIKYDKHASDQGVKQDAMQAAKEALSAARRVPATNRGHAKARAAEVHDSPVSLELNHLYSSFGTVIHDLAWHEWLIDSRRLLKGRVDSAMRDNYGSHVVAQFDSWRNDIAGGDSVKTDAMSKALRSLRKNLSMSAMGYNLMTAAMQPLGISQSVVRVGGKWVAQGITEVMGDLPGSISIVEGKSEFMRNRARTRFRELSELRNMVQNENGTLHKIQANAYYPMMRMQQLVDVPTWIGGYKKAIANGSDEDQAIAIADQGVIDSQGGGEMKDRAAIERSPFGQLFNAFYAYMNTAYQLNNMVLKSDKSAGRKAADLLMIDVVPVVLGYMLKQALTPSAGDDDDWDWEKITKDLLADEVGFVFGTMIVVREFGELAKAFVGGDFRDYQGPSGLRYIVDTYKLGNQVLQGEFDDGFRKSAINLLGDVVGIPAVQTNRVITGVKALNEGKTENPTAIAFGFQNKQ